MMDYKSTAPAFSHSGMHGAAPRLDIDGSLGMNTPHPPLKSSMRKTRSPSVKEKAENSHASSMEASNPSPRLQTFRTYMEEPPQESLRRTPFWRGCLYAVRYFFIVSFVGMGLAILLILFRTEKSFGYDDEDEDQVQAILAKQRNNLIFYVFCWLEATWLAACVCHLVTLLFPFVFYFVSGYVNAAHRRYWRVFGTLKWPVTLFGAALASFITFHYLVQNNPDLVANLTRQDGWDWGDSLDNILEQCIYWSVAYLLEKILILYISIHYHYRMDLYRIQRSKMLHSALCALYDASIYLHPPYSPEFSTEDLVLHSKRAPTNGSIRKGAAQFLQKIGGAADSAFSFISQAAGASSASHWGKANSTYALVEHALGDPKSAAALAKRIWVSLVASGKNALTIDDIAEAFGPHRREEAEFCFNLLDENENGDIRLSEFVPTVVEAGRVRHDVYAGLHDINHAINTFNWVALLVIAMVMVYFILLSYVEFIRNIQQSISFSVLGIAFAVGRTIHEFLTGAVMVFFKHPFDIGDRVTISNPGETQSAPVIVKRISLLYVVFERVDDGTETQWPNIRLAARRVDNITRSGLNKQLITLEIDFSTPFKDIQLLRAELQNFLSQRENARDYRPEFGLVVSSIADMSKMELQCTIIHKSNWSDEALRAYRASRFLCALIGAVRRVPIAKPGGAGAKTGDEGKPSYQVIVTEEAAAKKRDEQAACQRKRRMDYAGPPPAAAADTPIEGVSPLAGSAAAAADIQEEDAAAKKAREEEEKREKEREEAAAMGDFMAIPLTRRPTLGGARPSVAEGDGRAHSIALSAFPFIAANEVGARRSPRGIQPAGTWPQESEGWKYGIAR